MAGPRQTQPKRLEIAPGIFTEATDSGAVQRWKDGDMVRFSGPMPEKIGGSVTQTLTFADGTSTEIMGHVRAVLDWASFDRTKIVAIGTECKLYLIANLTVYDITPIRKQSNRTDPFTTTNGSPTVTVSDPSFGGQVGDHVRFRDATAVGGITIDGEYQISEVIDSDTYRIIHTANASSSATGGGVVVIQYDISCGLEDDGTILTGYGTGDYGLEDYGNSMDETSTYAGNARIWSLGKFGEDLLASPRGQGLYWWDRTNGVNSRATLVETAPSSIERFFMSSDERYAIALGTNEVSTDNVDKMLIRWCDTNDFTNWFPALLVTDTSFAGFSRPTVGNTMVASVRSDTLHAVWSDRAMYRMDYVGEPKIFDVTQVGEEVRIMGPNCAIEVDSRIYFMARDNFYIFDGNLRILECDIWTKVFRDVNRDQASKFYVWANTNFSEIWFHYCSANSNENDRVAILNTRLKVWYYNTIQREAGHSVGAFGYPYAFYLGELYLHENGYNDGADDSPMWAYIESWDAELAEGAYNMLTHDLEPDADELEGSVQAYLRAKERPNSTDYTEVGPFDIFPGTEIVNPRIKGGVVALRWESSELDDYWRMGPPRLRFGPYGRRG